MAIGSFEKVKRTREPDTLPLLRFDVPRPAEDGGGFEKRYWSITAIPVLDDAGEVAVMLQHPIDVTELERLKEIASPALGDVVLSARPPSTYAAFMTVRDAALPLEDAFLSPEERAQHSQTRDPFVDDVAEN